MLLLHLLPVGASSDTTKPFKGVGSGVFEIALRFKTDAYRLVYAVQIGKRLYVLHAFQKNPHRASKRPCRRSRSSSAATGKPLKWRRHNEKTKDHGVRTGKRQCVR
jgi:phage-related protein